MIWSWSFETNILGAKFCNCGPRIKTASKFFVNETNPVHTGFKIFIDQNDETVPDRNLLVQITPSMKRAYSDLSMLEIDSVFWKLVLNIEEGLLREDGKLMCFSYDEQKSQRTVLNVFMNMPVFYGLWNLPPCVRFRQWVTHLFDISVTLRLVVYLFCTEKVN